MGSFQTIRLHKCSPLHCRLVFRRWSLSGYPSAPELPGVAELEIDLLPCRFTCCFSARDGSSGVYGRSSTVGAAEIYILFRPCMLCSLCRSSVHTWSHPYLTTLTNEQIVAELGWTAKAIKEITGVTPNTVSFLQVHCIEVRLTTFMHR